LLLHATAEEMQLDILKLVEDKEKDSDKTRGQAYGQQRKLKDWHDSVDEVIVTPK